MSGSRCSRAGERAGERGTGEILQLDETSDRPQDAALDGRCRREQFARKASRGSGRAGSASGAPRSRAPFAPTIRCARAFTWSSRNDFRGSGGARSASAPEERRRPLPRGPGCRRGPRLRTRRVPRGTRRGRRAGGRLRRESGMAARAEEKGLAGGPADSSRGSAAGRTDRSGASRPTRSWSTSRRPPSSHSSNSRLEARARRPRPVRDREPRVGLRDALVLDGSHPRAARRPRRRSRSSSTANGFRDVRVDFRSPVPGERGALSGELRRTASRARRATPLRAAGLRGTGVK